MKRSKKFLTVLCMLCMIMAMAVPTFAVSTPDVPSCTPSYEAKVDTNNQTQTVNWPMTNSYAFYKVWFSNTTSSSTVRVALYKGNTTGDPVNYLDVPAGQAMSLRNTDKDSPIETDTYYIVLTVLGGAENLKGLCFYKAENPTSPIIINGEAFDAISAHTTMKEPIMLPRTNLSGTSGNSCGEFVAGETNVSFSIVSAPATETYNVQLYHGTISGGGKPVFLYAKDVPIASGACFSDLEAGETYFFKISSSDAPVSGSNAKYSFKTFSTVADVEE